MLACSALIRTLVCDVTNWKWCVVACRALALMSKQSQPTKEVVMATDCTASTFFSISDRTLTLRSACSVSRVLST